MRRCGCRRKRGLRMSGRGCVAAGGIGLSEGYDPAAVNRWVAVNRHSLFGNFGPAPHSRRGFFVRGRGHGNPQEFFGKRNFALLIVVYRSPFGIVRESVPLARTLAACPAPGGAFLCGPPRSRATDDAAPRWGGGLAGHPARDEQPRRHGPNGRQAHSSMCKSCTVQPTVLLPLWGLPPRGKPPFGR